MATSKKESKSRAAVEYRIARVSVKSFSEQLIELSEEQFKGFGFQIAFGADLKEEASLISVGTKVQVQVDGAEDESKELISMEVICSFRIKDIGVLKNDEGQVKVPRILFANLIGISLSTARGVLIGRSRYSELEEYPIPMLHPTKMVGDFAEAANISWIEAE